MSQGESHAAGYPVSHLANKVLSNESVLKIWGSTMLFERAINLANNTPTDALCGAWGLDAADVDARKRKETPLSIREAGSLAELHGLRLEDILPV